MSKTPEDYHPILCIDFDGVIHSYTSGWQGIDMIPDLPVEGAIEWLRGLIEDKYFSVNIYSSRSSKLDGRMAMRRWLRRYGLSEDEVGVIKFPFEKPAAFLTVDDRAICFSGRFPTIEGMKLFKPWWYKEKEK